MYMCPNVMQQLSCALMTVLRETRQTYAGQILECENRNGQRIFVDSQYESFLMNFLRKSVLQFDRSIDQDFRSLSLSKLHVKSLISKRINDTLAISQKDKNMSDSEKLSKRQKLDKLIEKLVTQRMDKREKEIKKLENEKKDDVVRWLNPKSQSDGQTINDSTVYNSALSKLEKSQKILEAADILAFSIPEHSISKKESSLPQRNKNNNDHMDIDVVVIDSDSASEIDIENIPSKSILRKPSLDSSQLNPFSKRLKPSSIFSPNNIQLNGNSSSIQSNKNPHLSSSFLSESSTFPSSPPIPNSSSTAPNSSTGQTTNGSQYSQINYQYPNMTNGFRPFHNESEELNAALRSPTSSNGNKAVNVSQSSGIHLPSIQGLLEISNRASIQPPPPNPLPNVVVVESNSTIIQHSSFPTPLLPSFQNNPYYSYNQQQSMSRTTSPPDSSSPIQRHLINNTSTGSTSTNSRHYIPIAPSPITTTTGGGNRPPQTSTSTSIFTNNTTNHLTFPAAESDYQWKL
ncbi:hypothetical protein C1645_20437 [Glomus cerebriforme]|uniref:Uncharacterized protein n=1 Tax=Glomus cerebriforme TaxID=658196 RepID=A0A397TA52_9GLOM|nr:hypothetical protein C1645_20437 [Glomus cerebriforme]